MYFSSGKERSIVLINLNTNLILTTKTKSNNLVKVLFIDYCVIPKFLTFIVEDIRNKFHYRNRHRIIKSEAFL